jgi:hypothetical protein
MVLKKMNLRHRAQWYDVPLPNAARSGEDAIGLFGVQVSAAWLLFF